LYISQEIIPREEILKVQEEKGIKVLFCPSCGAKILDKTGDFCSKCGSPLK